MNTGHGHVTPREDGAKARCGGPGLCSECARELAQKIHQEDLAKPEKEKLERLRDEFAMSATDSDIESILVGRQIDVILHEMGVIAEPKDSRDLLDLNKYIPIARAWARYKYADAALKAREIK